MSRQLLTVLFLILQLWLGWMAGEQLLWLGIILVGCVWVARVHTARELNRTQQRWILIAGIGLLLTKLWLAPTDARDSSWINWQGITFAMAYGALLVQLAELELQAARMRLATHLLPAGAVAIACYFSQANMGQQGFSIGTALVALLLPLALLEVFRSEKAPVLNYYRLGAMLFLFSFATLLAIQVDMLYLETVPRVQSLIEAKLGARSGPERSIRGYIRHATLSSVAFEKTNDAQEMAISVVCKQMPGYMRGAAYDSFVSNEWQSLRSRFGFRNRNIHVLTPTENPPAEFPPAERLNWFEMQSQAKAPWITLSIGNDPRRGKMFFLPLEVDLIQSNSVQIALDEHSIVREGISTRNRYLAAVGPGSRHAILSDDYRDVLLTIPQHLQTPLAELRKQILTANLTTTEKILEVERYFRSNYSYTLEGFKSPSNIDSLTFFLKERPAAHCEYFATAAALLLRSAEVPTRYVTGYTVVTSSWGDSERWIGRNRDAHAWVEAYDAKTEQWHIVEATPGVNMPKYLRGNQAEQESAVAQRASGLELTNETEEWFWSRWFIFRNRAVDTWITLGSAGIILCGGGWLLVRRMRNRQHVSEQTQQLTQLHRMLHNVETRLRRQRMIRHPAETLLQFSQRLRKAAYQQPQFIPFADWLCDYAQLMYSNPHDAVAYAAVARSMP